MSMRFCAIQKGYPTPSLRYHQSTAPLIGTSSAFTHVSRKWVWLPNVAFQSASCRAPQNCGIHCSPPLPPSPLPLGFIREGLCRALPGWGGGGSKAPGAPFRIPHAGPWTGAPPCSSAIRSCACWGSNQRHFNRALYIIPPGRHPRCRGAGGIRVHGLDRTAPPASNSVCCQTLLITFTQHSSSGIQCLGSVTL